MSVIGGKLKLKGAAQSTLDAENKKYKKEKPKASEADEDDVELIPEQKKVQKIIEHPPHPGTGRIITSGTTVHGQETKFKTELANGDKIIITKPDTLEKEEREIMVVFSDKSALLSSAFSSNLITGCPFEIKKKPEVKEEETLEEKFNEKLNKMSKKIKKEENSVFEYREKVGMWGYKTIREKQDRELTREELLDMRAKKNRDKFCWF